MKWMQCTLCPNKVRHGFPYNFGKERHLLCGDCMRKVREGYIPKRIREKQLTRGK